MDLQKIAAPDELVNRIELSNDEVELLDELYQARAVAKEVFAADPPTIEMIAGCRDFVLCYTKPSEQKETIDQLYKSIGIAKDFFSTDAPTAQQVFFVYDHQFADAEDDGEEDKEEDDE
jgi:hypothetical protein